MLFWIFYTYIPSKTHMEPYQNMKVWNTWIFEVCKISAFWILLGFFFGEKAQCLHTLGRSRYEWFLTFRGGGGEADFLGFFYCFLNVEARLKLQRVHVVGDVLELILMTQLSKEHSNWLDGTYLFDPKKTIYLFMIRKFFHICILGYLGYVPGVCWNFLGGKTASGQTTMAIAPQSRLELWKVQIPASLWLVYQKA